MWKVIFDEEKGQYYLKHSDGRIKYVPLITDIENRYEFYQNEYGKAYTMCEMYNGEVVFLNRIVRGKIVVYKHQSKEK